MKTSLQSLIHEALGYEAEAFDNDSEVNGADLVEWFAEWRERAKVITRIQQDSIAGASESDRPKRAKSPQREYCVTAAELSEAIDALGEAAETRRSDFRPKAGQEAINKQIAKTYEHTARMLKDVRRILERDQAVLRPTATIRDRVVRPNMQPRCSECGSANVCADAAARWSIDTQEWEVSNVFDKGHGCDDCESSDIEFVWAEVRQDLEGKKEGRDCLKG